MKLQIIAIVIFLSLTDVMASEVNKHKNHQIWIL